MSDIHAEPGAGEWVEWKEPVPRPDHYCEPPKMSYGGHNRERRMISAGVGELASGTIWRCTCGRAWVAGAFNGSTHDPDPSYWTRYSMEDGPAQVAVKRPFRKTVWVPSTQRRELTA